MDLLLLFKALILGLVEGATEFLPVSSTGHLIIVGDLLNFNDDKGKVFEIVIQLGAILAVCWEFRHRLTHTISHIPESQAARGLVLNLLIAFLPAAILGLLFHHQIKQYLFSPITVSIALIVGGIAILFIEKNAPKSISQTIEAITPTQALKVGLAQALALVPGVSRAGATILGGVAFGLNRQTYLVAHAGARREARLAENFAGRERLHGERTIRRRLATASLVSQPRAGD